MMNGGASAVKSELAARRRGKPHLDGDGEIEEDGRKLAKGEEADGVETALALGLDLGGADREQVQSGEGHEPGEGA